MFGISRQAYYKRQQRVEKLEEDRAVLLSLIRPIRKKMHRIGTIKLYDLIKDDMARNNIKLGRDKLFTFLRQENMLVKKKKNFTKTTDSFHRFYKHKNLVKGLEVTAPEEVWVSDITYIKTELGHGYLSLITDYYSKRIMGYHLADNLKTESSLKALEMAIRSRSYPDRKLIHHSDRGFQYCSDDYTAMLSRHSIQPSMTEVHDPYENAVTERVNELLKDEFDIGDGLVDQMQAAKEIKDTVETYNTLRLNFSCEKLTPQQAYEAGTYQLNKWGGKKRHRAEEVKEQSSQRHSDIFLNP